MASTWLITGSSRGLGRAITKAALEVGHNVAATARKPDQLAEFTAQYGDQVRAIALDVTDPAAAQSAVRAAVEAFSGLDVVVNNAGYANVNSVEDFDEADFREQIETNFFGVVNVTRAALPILRERGAGNIIQIASIGGRVSTPGLSAYQSAKWAVEGFSEVLSREVGPLGIHVTIVEPGGFRTDWAGSSMCVSDIQPAYQQTIGAVSQHIRAAPDMAQGDPDKAAKIIVDIPAMAKPPLRLLLGSDAVHIAEIAAEQRAVEDGKWRELSLSTDFDGTQVRTLEQWAQFMRPANEY